MRQFISRSAPDAAGRLTVTGSDCRYLARVLRVRPGAEIDVRLPSGLLSRMAVESVSSVRVVLSGAELLPDTGLDSGVFQGVGAADVAADTARLPELWLFQAVPKIVKMDLIVRQAAETGAAKIVPVLGEYSPRADCGAPRLERWNRIIKEALQQSGSAVQTEVLPAQTVAGAASLWRQAVLKADAEKKTGAAFILCETAVSPLERKSLYGYLTNRPDMAAVAVGSEGGFSPGELETFFGAGFLPLHFATNILRAETAALYGMAVLQSVIMEFDSWKYSGSAC